MVSEDSCASSFIEEELLGDTGREARMWVRKVGETMQGCHLRLNPTVLILQKRLCPRVVPA